MKILFFGLTGSIGKSFLKCSDDHDIVGFAYNNNEKLALEIVKKFNIKYYYSPNKKSNVECIDDLILRSKPDLIVNAVDGYIGLQYTLKALEYKIDLALANKESLVMAGKFVINLVKKNGVKLFPIDSEHSSLCELIKKQNKKNIKKLYITCSGGSCYSKSRNELEKITYNDVIKHPNWSMGSKISFDSATLINKCFEIVEAYFLFNTKNIEALYHPQSIIHSLVEFNDNTVFANLSHPDMAISVSLAINGFKKHNKCFIKQLDFTNLNLQLTKIDKDKWKPIAWAYDIINDKNNSLGIIINFANEKAIELFKNKKIKFVEFYSIIEYYIKKYKDEKVLIIDDINKLLDKLKLDNHFNL